MISFVLIIKIIECRFNFVLQRKSQPINTSTEESEEKNNMTTKHYRMKKIDFDLRKLINTVDDTMDYKNSRRLPPLAQKAAFIGNECTIGKIRINEMCLDID